MTTNRVLPVVAIAVGVYLIVVGSVAEHSDLWGFLETTVGAVAIGFGVGFWLGRTA